MSFDTGIPPLPPGVGGFPDIMDPLPIAAPSQQPPAATGTTGGVLPGTAEGGVLPVERQGIFRFIDNWFGGGIGLPIRQSIQPVAVVSQDTWMVLRNDNRHYLARDLATPGVGENSVFVLQANLQPLVVEAIGITSIGTDTKFFRTAKGDPIAASVSSTVLTSAYGRVVGQQDATALSIITASANLPDPALAERMRDNIVGMPQPLGSNGESLFIELLPGEQLQLWNETTTEGLQFYCFWREMTPVL